MCPWNASFAEPTSEEAYLAGHGLDGPALIEWMGMTEEEFGARFRKSPIKRAKRRGLLRNVAVALGNWGSQEAVPALVAALEDEEPLVRGHAAWALGRIGSAESITALSSRLTLESEESVVEELTAALAP